MFKRRKGNNKTGNWFLDVLILGAGIISAIFLPEYLRFIPIITSIMLFVLRKVWRILKSKVLMYEIDDDLVYLVTHMYAVSTGKPPRKRLFWLNNIAGGYGIYDRYLRKIANLAVEWGYGFNKAIRIVVREVKNKTFRDFLLRLGEILNIGEDPERFLDVERRAFLTEYQAHYGRVIEATKLLLGVYTSSVSSAIFLVITFLIFSLLFSTSPNTIIFVYIGIAMALGLLIYVIYKVLPRDRVTHTMGIYPLERRKYRLLLTVGVTLSIIVGLYTYSMTGIPSLAMSLGAAPLLLPGFYARRIEKKIREIEAFFPIFIRSFGLTYATVPHVPTALASVLRSDYGPLTRYLKRLLARLSLGVSPKISWLRFIGETWSEIIRRNINIVYDAIDAGGNLAEVGTVLSETTFRILDMRKQRVQVSKAFESTIYIIHTLFSAVLSFVLTLMNIFYLLITTIQQSSAYVPSVLPFQPIPVELVDMITPIFIVILAILNATAIKVAQGGMYETVWVPLAILLFISGVVMQSMQTLAETLFSGILEIVHLVEIT